jgi:hypothetical protein
MGTVSTVPWQYGVNSKDKLKKFPHSPTSHACEFADLNQSSLVVAVETRDRSEFGF